LIPFEVFKKPVLTWGENQWTGSQKNYHLILRTGLKTLKVLTTPHPQVKLGHLPFNNFATRPSSNNKVVFLFSCFSLLLIFNFMPWKYQDYIIFVVF